MYEAVIFDFDGVILNSEPIHYKACVDVFNAIGLSLSHSEYFKKYIGLSDKQMFPAILIDKEKADLFTPDGVEHLISKKVEAYNAYIAEAETLPLINGLKDYIDSQVHIVNKFAICTGSSKAEVMTVLKKINHKKIFPCLDVIVTVEDIQQGKPSPEGYLLTAKRLEVSPSQCLVIEDSPHGIDAAKTAGMYVIALATSFDEAQLQKADRIVDDFTFI